MLTTKQSKTTPGKTDHGKLKENKERNLFDDLNEEIKMRSNPKLL